MVQSHALTLDELESKILGLPQAARARLAGTLLRSLTEVDDETTKAWLDEAERRDREMGDDPKAGVPAQDVLRKARASLK